MKRSDDLKHLLLSIDRKSYPAYKDTRGQYQFNGFVLSIDHVKGDPFASPSKVSIVIEGKQAGFPAPYLEQRHTRVALQDHLSRLFGQAVEKYNFKAKGSGKSGLISVSRCGQEVLERTACTLTPGSGRLLVRLEVGFPANGRTINSGELIKIFFEFLPKAVASSLFYRNIDQKQVESVIWLAEDQQFIRDRLPELGLCAFVADGSILPRKSGVSQLPMARSVAFQSPESLRVTLELPHKGSLAGMGIPKGITLIVGGGYHGKSTLLRALELGVYNHIRGDGREYVITDDTALKLRAEDGRSICKTDISMFVNNLPNGRDTTAFSTEDASGSTSQAANVVEGLEAGSSLFLIDEDTSATNFMIRDELMQQVICREKEPITPFIERVKGLYEQAGVSSVIVAGSSGSYFHIADLVIQMDCYRPFDITAMAKEKAAAYPGITPLPLADHALSFRRLPRPNPSVARDSRVKLKVGGRDSLSINREEIELRCLEQLADREQTEALAYMLLYAIRHFFDGRRDMAQIADELLKLVNEKGLEAVGMDGGSYLSAGLAMPRKQEVLGCFNRYRKLEIV